RFLRRRNRRCKRSRRLEYASSCGASWAVSLPCSSRNRDSQNSGIGAGDGNLAAVSGPGEPIACGDGELLVKECAAYCRIPDEQFTAIVERGDASEGGVVAQSP